ncbi:MAG TPA: tRNA (cytidine(56)-2'-O)-methyltransferase, partial [Thermoplasmata archaeon]|nr:tRNA (cytidine(56)-2'-O)-methyltransferase [Thermoplasmata archaeon]
MTIAVLRLGHRPARDKRVTTHVALTARAFGADAVFVSTRDAGLERTLHALVARFGGTFEVRTGVPWR